MGGEHEKDPSVPIKIQIRLQLSQFQQKTHPGRAGQPWCSATRQCQVRRFLTQIPGKIYQKSILDTRGASARGVDKELLVLRVSGGRHNKAGHFCSFSKVTRPSMSSMELRCRPGRRCLRYRASGEVKLGVGSPGGALTCSPGSPHIHSSRRAAAADGSGRSRPEYP